MVKNKKNLRVGIVSLIVAIAIIALIIWLIKLPRNSGVLLEDGTILSEARCQGLESVIVIHGAGCPACAIALPRLRELEQELNMNFSYYDLAVEQDREKVLSLGLIPKAIPTVIIRCKVYVGVYCKEEYRKAFLN